MKGVVFTEFMELVESRWGFDMLDRIIDAASLPHDGAYVSTGTYDHAELVAMVMALSQETEIAVPDLVRAFGEHLFARFATQFEVFFHEVHDARSFLERVDGVIHVEVRKLYPGAELPEIRCRRLDDGSMHVVYRSSRSFGDLAEGLIIGCIRHYEEDLAVGREDQPCDSGSHIVFHLTNREAA